MQALAVHPGISDEAFDRFRAWIHRAVGIRLSEQKKALVVGRLAPRLRFHGMGSYEEYYALLTGGTDPAEPQIAIDLLTTNETHFFREPRHFDFLRERILPAHPPGRTLRVWSAASSSGEEPYSIAMTLAACLGETPWEVFASDVSSRMLERAGRGQYPMSRAQEIPLDYLREHCLRGIGAQQGTFIIDPALRSRIRFAQVNLNEPLPDIGDFDVIFLRNVMIYFDCATKREVVARVGQRLRPDGHLLVGHSESLHGLDDRLKPVRPAIYRKT